MFGVSGGNLTARMRKDAFEAMLKQEMGWFDKVENNTGSLCARLSGDAARVQGATGARAGSIMQGVAGALIAVFMGLYFNWKLGLVCTLFFPFLIIAVFVKFRIIRGVDSAEKVAFEKSAKVNIVATLYSIEIYSNFSWP
jgi:ATP-binding cassette subfamily B (MDR/TAP) protein 1